MSNPAPITVRIRNFQSIKDATFVLDRLTGLTGANNAGKSAAFRAMRAPFVNLKGHSFVRHGAEKAEVDWDFGDGHTLHWEKGEKVKPMYQIDGGEKIYPGVAVPDEVLKLGIAPIRVGDKDIWPQIAPQVVGQTFLLDQPGSVLAEVVADVDRVGQLNRALKAAESDRRAATTELKVRRTDETRQTKEVEQYDGLDAVLARVAEAERALARLSKVSRAVEAMEALHARLVRARGTVASLAGIEAIPLPDRDRLTTLESGLTELDGLLALQARLARARRGVALLAEADSIPLARGETFSEISSNLSELAVLRGLSDRLSKARADVERLGGIQAIAVAGDTSYAEKVRAGLKLLTGLQERRSNAVAQVKRLEAELAARTQAAAEAEAVVRATLGDLRECPVCGATVSPSR